MLRDTVYMSSLLTAISGQVKSFQMSMKTMSPMTRIPDFTMGIAICA